LKSKTIFVTGGTGFLGSYLLRYLVKKGYQNIKALKRKNSSLALVEEVKDRIQWIDGDLQDILSLELAMEGVDQVYHCAANVSFNKKEVKKMMRTNVEGTANIVNIALDFGIEKLVHISSIAALGRSKDQKNVDEKTPWQRDNANSNYAISKYLSEQEVWRGIAEGLPAAILNPSVIIGSGFWDVGTSQMFQEVWKGLRFYPVGASGFVDVRDVALLAIKLMESDQIKERFIVNNKNCNYLEFFSEVAKKLNKKAPDIKVSPILRGLAWRLDWLRSKFTGRPHLITKETANLVSNTFHYDNSKSIQTFDYRYIPFEKSLTDITDQFIESKKLGKKYDYLPLA
jgi:nucleoside-diphosphate-sugar epimerase